MSKINLVLVMGVLLGSLISFAGEINEGEPVLPFLKSLTIQFDIEFSTDDQWRSIVNGKLAKDERKYAQLTTLCLIHVKSTSEIKRTLRQKTYPGELFYYSKSNESLDIYFPLKSKVSHIECFNMTGIASERFIKPDSGNYFVPRLEEVKEALEGVIHLELNDNGDID